MIRTRRARLSRDTGRAGRLPAPRPIRQPRLIGAIPLSLLILLVLAPTEPQGALSAQIYLGSDDGSATTDAMPGGHRTFQVAGRWAKITGMTINVKHRIGSLLGEPWEVSSVRFDFDERTRITIYQRTVERDPDGLSAPSAFVVIRPTSTGSLRVIDKRIGQRLGPDMGGGPSWEIEVPLSQFREWVRLTDVYFNFTHGGSNEGIRRRYMGVLFGAGEWGWDVPGSPSWNRVYESLFGRAGALLPGGGGRSYIRRGGAVHLRISDITFVDDARFWAEQGAEPAPESERASALFDSYRISMDLGALLYRVGQQDSDFVQALYRGRVSLVAMLAGSINAGAADRERRLALLERAVAQAGDLPGDVQMALERARGLPRGLRAGARDREIASLAEQLLASGQPVSQGLLDRAGALAEAVGENPAQFGTLGVRFAEAFARAGALTDAETEMPTATGWMIEIEPADDLQFGIGDWSVVFENVEGEGRRHEARDANRGNVTYWKSGRRLSILSDHEDLRSFVRIARGDLAGAAQRTLTYVLRRGAFSLHCEDIGISTFVNTMGSWQSEQLYAQFSILGESVRTDRVSIQGSPGRNVVSQCLEGS